MVRSDLSTIVGPEKPVPQHVAEACRKLIGAYGITFTPARLQTYAEALGDLDPTVLAQATMRLIQSSEKPPSISRIRDVAAEVRGEVRAAAPASARSQRVVCPLCALAYTVSAESFAHTCEPGAIAYFRTESGRAEKQARGMAACTGRAVEARPIQRGLLDADR